MIFINMSFNHTYGSFLTESFLVLTDSRMFLHLLLVWIVSLLFCWKIVPAFSHRKQGNKQEKEFIEDNNVDLDATALMPPPEISLESNSFIRSRYPSVRSPALPVNLNDSRLNREEKSFLSKLEFEICGKAKEAGKHPSYTTLVLTLIHNYNVDINKPVLSNKYTIFHCACLSCSLELVSSLTPLADLEMLTTAGDTPLYLAVYAAAHRVKSQPESCQEGLDVVHHLIAAGCDVNKTNKSGWTPLHQASRLGHQQLVRLLLDYGAEMKTSYDAIDYNETAEKNHDDSILSRCSSIVTRSMSKKKSKVENLDKSFLKGLSPKVLIRPMKIQE